MKNTITFIYASKTLRILGFNRTIRDQYSMWKMYYFTNEMHFTIDKLRNRRKFLQNKLLKYIKDYISKQHRRKKSTYWYQNLS